MNNTSPPTAADLDRIENYLASDAANPHLLTTAIEMCLALGKLDRAREHADAAVRAHPGDPFAAARRGNVLIAQGQLDEAARVFQQLLLQQADPAIAYNLALVHFRMGQFTQARAVLEPYMQADDATVALVTLFLRTLHHVGEIRQALAVVERHMARCGADAEFLGAASLLHFDDGQLEDAARLSRAALAGGARPIDAMVVAGSVALGQDDADTAKAMFGQALAASPSDGRSWSGLGMASLLDGNLDDAREQLLRATVNMPTHIGTWHALAWCQAVRGELDDAQRSFEQALAIDRNFGETHGGLAVISALKGRREEAQAGIERAKRLDADGLSAVYAQMILSGVAADPARFKKMALRIFSARPGLAGTKLAEAMAKRI